MKRTSFEQQWDLVATLAHHSAADLLVRVEDWRDRGHLLDEDGRRAALAGVLLRSLRMLDVTGRGPSVVADLPLRLVVEALTAWRHSPVAQPPSDGSGQHDAASVAAWLDRERLHSWLLPDDEYAERPWRRTVEHSAIVQALEGRRIEAAHVEQGHVPRRELGAAQVEVIFDDGSVLLVDAKDHVDGEHDLKVTVDDVELRAGQRTIQSTFARLVGIRVHGCCLVRSDTTWDGWMLPFELHLFVGRQHVMIAADQGEVDVNSPRDVDATEDTGS